MFERFTDRARRVVTLAQEEARCLKHDYVGTEHMLIALLNEGEGIAAKALVALGQNAKDLREEVCAVVGEGQEMPSGHIPFTPRAKRVLELSLREGLQLGHNYIGTEHLLLALIREGEGVAAQILAKKGCDLVRARQLVMQLLGYPPPTRIDLQKERDDAVKKTAEVREEWAKQVQQLNADIHQAFPAAKHRAGDTYKDDVISAIQAEAAASGDKSSAFGSGTYSALVGGGGAGGGGGGSLTAYRRSELPKVSVDQDQFEEVKRGLAYVVSDPFSGEVKLYGLQWTGRVITGVDWEGSK